MTKIQIAVGHYQDGHVRRLDFLCLAGKAPSMVHAKMLLAAAEGTKPLARVEIELNGEVVDCQTLA